MEEMKLDNEVEMMLGTIISRVKIGHNDIKDI